MSRKTAYLITMLVPLLALAQSDPTIRVGRIVSHSFLQSITNPQQTEYRVGVINAAASTGMLVSPQDSEPVVKFMTGNDSWLWVSAAEQIGSDEAIRFEIVSKVVEAGSCEMLKEAHRNFYEELERSLSEEIPLNSLPVRPPVKTITMDGTRFPIQIYTGTNHVTIMADRDVNRDLQRASYELHLIVSGCSNEVDGIVEERYL